MCWQKKKGPELFDTWIIAGCSSQAGSQARPARVALQWLVPGTFDQVLRCIWPSIIRFFWSNIKVNLTKLRSSLKSWKTFQEVRCAAPSAMLSYSLRSRWNHIWKTLQFITNLKIQLCVKHRPGWMHLECAPVVFALHQGDNNFLPISSLFIAKLPRHIIFNFLAKRRKV